MKYKVGDKVKVRQWNDMTKEFEINSHGSIVTSDGCHFVDDMKEYCGKILEIKRVAGTRYQIKGNDYWWTDDMFEDNTYTDRFNDEMDSLTYVKPLEHLAETRKKEKKQMTHREKLEQRLEDARLNSIVKSVEVVVPGKVVKVKINEIFGLEEYKLVCDPQDEFSIERAIILALVKNYNSDLTTDGVEYEADKFKFYKSNIEDLKAAMRVYKAQTAIKEYDEKEKVEQERIRENKKRKKIAQKQRRAERLAKEKLSEQKESAKIYADALKEVLAKYDIPSNTATEIQNDMEVKL